jgi:glycosyltransferase involved in cell wall biosynthesis
VPVPPRKYGGTEGVVDRLARGFVAAGHEVVLFTTGDATCPVPREWVLDRAAGDRIGSAVPELRHIIGAYADVDGFDVVHDHTIIGPFYAAVSGVDPLVVTTNHGPFNPELSDIYRRIGHRVPIIAISRHQASTARGVPIAGVIHHGVDPDTFPVGDGSGGYLLFLGRMVPEKGVHRAASIAREAGVPLLIAAKMREAAERAFFEAEVEPLLSHDIRYVGEVDDTERLKLLRGARALLNPIRWPEPFGLVMIEAMAAGTPIIAWPKGSAPEVIEHGRSGFLVESIDQAVAAVEAAGQHTRTDVRTAFEERFTVERMARDYVELYKRILAESPPSLSETVIVNGWTE